jgi:hypothetical protein
MPRDQTIEDTDDPLPTYQPYFSFFVRQTVAVFSSCGGCAFACCGHPDVQQLAQDAVHAPCLILTSYFYAFSLLTAHSLCIQHPIVCSLSLAVGDDLSAYFINYFFNFNVILGTKCISPTMYRIVQLAQSPPTLKN